MSKTQLYIGTNLLDFNGEINVKRQVNDYRDPAIGSSVKSYTLEIPLTITNRKHLEFIDDIRSRVEVTDEARLVVDGMEVIRGKLKILSADRLSARAIIEGTDWVSDIAGTSIKDLSWAGGDQHEFLSASVTGSWGAAAGAFYRYPLINFGTLYSGEFGAGSKVYPYDFYPMWNIEDIVTKMFLDAGYTVAGSGFFASTEGQRQYVLSAPVPNDDDFISGKELLVYVDDNSDNYDSVSVDASATDTVELNQTLKIDAEDTDEGEDFSTGTYRYTAAADGTYRFQSQIKVQCSANVTPGSWLILEQNITYSIRKNGVALESYADAETNPPEPTIFDSGNSFDLDTGWVHLDQNDYIDVHIFIDCEATNQTGGALTLDLFILNGVAVSYLQATWDERNLWPGLGYTFDPAVMLPDIDGVAFLKGLKEAFNLRFFMDRLNKTIYIETADDFYGSTVIDWSDRIDYSEDVKMEVISSSYSKRQELKWKPDTGDKAYVNYVSANGIPFTKDITLTSEYLKEGKTVRENSVFSPTIHANMQQIGHSDGKVSKISGSEDFVSTSKPYPAYRPKQWLPRLMSWQGAESLVTGNYDYHDDMEDATGTNYTTFYYGKTKSMSDHYSEFMVSDWKKIDGNKILTCTLVLTPAEIMKFMTVVGTAANEGFRATYKLNIEGVDMLFICSKIITDGDRVQGEFIQKM